MGEDNKAITRAEYSELVMMLIDGASFQGKESEKVTELKQITLDLGTYDPWALDEATPPGE